MFRVMSERRYRVLAVASHPVQYQSPVFRALAQDPRFDIQVVYCSLAGAEKALDADFGVEFQWDVPLLEGYPWIEVHNFTPRSSLGRFLGLLNLGLWTVIRDGRFDAVVTYTGYACASFWIAATAAKISRTPLLFGTDATSLRPRSGQSWRASVKKVLLPPVFKLASAVIVPSTAGVEFIRSLGIPPSRIFMTPFVVDNDWWRKNAEQVDRGAIRQKWRIPENAFVAVFCAKLQNWKRPLDALRAFAKASVPDSYLIFAGEGPLRPALEAETQNLGVASQVRFLGFINQSGLPAVYRSADLLVLPSEYDPCPAVVPEAMLCGCPAAISDQIRGRFDLVQHGETGFIFPCADTTALAGIIAQAFSDRRRLELLKAAALARMETWTIRENVDALLAAIQASLRNGKK
jgi:glycosyltransferase involved in cell wall biosynthesis